MARELELSFSDKEITPWVGTALMRRMLGKMDFHGAFKRAALPEQGSNRGYAPEQLVERISICPHPSLRISNDNFGVMQVMISWNQTVLGRVKLNVLPFPGVLSTQIFPPCASTIVLAMAKPSPDPRCSLSAR
jgi:hypothetical protein